MMDEDKLTKDSFGSMGDKPTFHQPHAQPYWSINNYSIQQNICYCRIHSSAHRQNPTAAVAQFARQYRGLESSQRLTGQETLPSRRSAAHSHHHHTHHHAPSAPKTTKSNNKDRQRSKSRKEHRNHHHHAHHHHAGSKESPQYYKSAPSSPVNVRHEYYPTETLLPPKKKSSPDPTRRNFLTLDKLERGSLLSDKTPGVTTPLMTGCCGGVMKELHCYYPAKKKPSDKSGVPRRSGSYSALDSVSTDSSEGIGDPPPSAPNPAGNCVKNIVQWMSKVGKGTTALLDNLPGAFKGEDHHVVMVGLDSAGKTTVLYRLKFDQYVNTVPTIGFNCEKIRGTVGDSRGLVFLVWDVGGQEKIRPLWRPYTRATDGIIFVVDSTDSGDRLDEAKLELHRIMKTQDNVGVPLLVIANKQDLPLSKTSRELEKILELSKLSLTSLCHLEPCCAVTGEGLDVAMDKLHELIVKRRKVLKRVRNKTR